MMLLLLAGPGFFLGLSLGLSCVALAARLFNPQSTGAAQ